MAQALSDDVIKNLLILKLFQHARFIATRDFRSLMKRAPKLDFADPGGASALHQAACNSNEDLLEHLLESGLPVEDQDDMGATPLLHCAAQGTIANMRVLVKKGANVHAKDQVGRKAIHYAVINVNAAAIVDFLLEQGLSIEERDQFRSTPLHYCARFGTLQSFEMLIGKGASIKTKSDIGATALHFAAVNEKTTEIIEFLLGHGMSVDERDEVNLTALHHSIQYSNVRNMKLLVEKGADVNAIGDHKITSLHLAAFHGDTTEILNFLVKKGVPIDAKDIQGRTPLMACACWGNLQKVKLLVEAGANIYAQDEDGDSALYFAATNDKTTDIIKYLLDQGMSLEVRDNHGRTPLLYTANNSNLKSVAFLCDSGADLGSRDNYQKTVLHHAASNPEGVPIIEYLLGKGIPVDVRDERYQSPLIIAKRFGHAANQKILLQHGARNEEPHPFMFLPNLSRMMNRHM